MKKWLVIALLWLPLWAKANDSCVILMYHHFSTTTPKSTSVSPELFEQHLKYLTDNQFNVLPLADVIHHLNERTLPPKCVALTTDDGYISIYENAYPLLKQYQLPMAVFVNTEAADKNFNAMMSWQQMQQIQGELIQFYNHSVSHQHLSELNEQDIHTEITRAQERLNQMLGVTKRFFAYPYGEYNHNTYEQIKSLDFVGFGQHSGVLGYHTDTALIPRFPMAAQYAKMDSFITKINTLAFDIIAQEPLNPIVKTGDNPTLTLTFSSPLTNDQQHLFTCFDSRGQTLQKKWLANNRVNVASEAPITTRRSRYNCTMPSNEKGRYYWYSYQWVNPDIAE